MYAIRADQQPAEDSTGVRAVIHSQRVEHSTGGQRAEHLTGGPGVVECCRVDLLVRPKVFFVETTMM